MHSHIAEIGRVSSIAYREHALEYAALGMVPIPTRDKIPLVKHFTKWTPYTARETYARLSERYPDANLGLVTGYASRLCVVDLDDPRPESLDLAQSIFGDTPAVVKTPSGGAHLYYRYAGERSGKLDRVDERLNGDIKAKGGFVVAPPSIRTEGIAAGSPYHFLTGSLDQLADLPKIAEAATTRLSETGNVVTSAAGVGSRNNDLFRLALREARNCDDFDTLRDVMETHNSSLPLPLPQREVGRLARSAWGYEEDGENWAGAQPRLVVKSKILNDLVDEPNAMVLLMKLMEAHEGRRDEFCVSARSMAKASVLNGWSETRIRKAREVLLERGYLQCTHEGGRGKSDPSRYAFCAASP